MTGLVYLLAAIGALALVLAVLAIVLVVLLLRAGRSLLGLPPRDAVDAEIVAARGRQKAVHR